MLETSEISDPKDREVSDILLKTKKWNPYCIRHCAITYYGDFLPEFALRKKVRWSMNSKQPARYMKNRMGVDITRRLLTRDGIAVDDEALKQRPVTTICSSCKYANRPELKNCIKCDWPLDQAVVEKIRSEQ